MNIDPSDHSRLSPRFPALSTRQKAARQRCVTKKDTPLNDGLSEIHPMNEWSKEFQGFQEPPEALKSVPELFIPWQKKHVIREEPPAANHPKLSPAGWL